MVIIAGEGGACILRRGSLREGANAAALLALPLILAESRFSSYTVAMDAKALLVRQVKGNHTETPLAKDRRPSERDAPDGQRATKSVLVVRKSDRRNSSFIPGSMAERLSMVWPLTCEVVSMSKKYDVEQPLQRDIVNIVRKKS